MILLETDFVTVLPPTLRFPVTVKLHTPDRVPNRTHTLSRDRAQGPRTTQLLVPAGSFSNVATFTLDPPATPGLDGCVFSLTVTEARREYVATPFSLIETTCNV